MSNAAASVNPGSADRFAARLTAAAADTERTLDRLLATEPAEGETVRPPRLLAAMRYASLDGGKRLRPFLVLESAELFGVPRERALTAGAAIECVHGYSLVHDDLPAMDDDDLRRGRPTLHRAFDQATAILAGDSLLTLAFDVLARPQVHPEPAVRIALVAGLAQAAGLGGMAGGQMFDLEAEARFGPPDRRDEAAVLRMQAMKTGALIRFACEAGAILGAAADEERGALARYGAALGQAFQIADDLLDVEGDASTLGKSVGKDAAHGKATLVDVLGREAAHARLDALVAEAETAVEHFGEAAATLRAAARYVAERRR